MQHGAASQTTLLARMFGRSCCQWRSQGLLSANGSSERSTKRWAAPVRTDWSQAPTPHWVGALTCTIRSTVFAFAIEPPNLIDFVPIFFKHLETPDALPDVRIEIREAGENHTALVVDGVERLRTSDAGQLIGAVNQTILEQIHPGIEWLAIIHGAAVARDGQSGFTAAAGSRNCPTPAVGFNVVHSQLNHEGYSTSGIELRQLLDLAMIRARHESAIDWSELDHRFSVAGFGHVLATYLKFAEVFFGQVAPRLSNMPRKLALERLRVFVEWPDRARRRAAYVTLAEENRALRSQLDALHQQLASVYSSTSWKISSPLRKVRQLIQLPRFGGPRRKAASCRSPASV